MSSIETHYSANNIVNRILAAIRAAGFDPNSRLSAEELSPLDHFHTGGYKASQEMLEAAQINAEDRVLDIGAGLAGAARMLAAEVGCHVSCIELSPGYCEGARLLNQITGLDEQIVVREGSALDLPFPDDSFDVAWMQNVGMNIADKRRLYEETARVLRPGGTFAFQEMAAGSLPTCYYPLPWATEPADSVLVPAEEICSLLEQIGFSRQMFTDTTDIHLSRSVANATPAPAGQLGLAVFVDNLAEKASNARRSLEEGQVRLVRGIFRKNP